MTTDKFRLKVAEVAIHAHSLPMRIPFNVAGTRLTAIEQITAEVRVIGPNGAEAIGLSADSPSAIWFDKERPADVVRDDLFAALHHAILAYCAMPPMSSFGLACEGNAAQVGWRLARGRALAHAIPETIAAFPCALLDRAILDALCKISGLSFFDMVRRNLPGVDARLIPDLRRFNLSAWLRKLAPRDRIAIRHTIAGLGQPRPDDDLPFTLAEVIRAYGNRHFKIKMNGDFDQNLAMFAEISSELTSALGADWRVTLDCNECFTTAAEFTDMASRMAGEPALRPFWNRVLYLEQPIHRRYWRGEPVTRVGKPVIIDETEGTFGDAALAFDLGYRGVSAKSVKGFYKALLNAAQVALVRPGCFLTAEDMNHPAGLALQQDIAVALLLGLPHAEKNGHHFLGPVAANAPYAPCPVVYHETYFRKGDRVGTRIVDGMLGLGRAVQDAGFMSRVARDPSSA